MVVYIRRRLAERNIRVVAESHDPSAAKICGKEILKPEFFGRGLGPCSSRIALQAVDCNDTRCRRRQLFHSISGEFQHLTQHWS